MKGTFEQVVTPIRQDVSTLKTDVEGLKKGQQSLEDRVAAIEGNNRQAGDERQWKPTFVDIKGFCASEEAKSKGINRAGAMELIEKLKLSSDPSLRARARARAETRDEFLDPHPDHAHCTDGDQKHME